MVEPVLAHRRSCGRQPLAHARGGLGERVAAAGVLEGLGGAHLRQRHVPVVCLVTALEESLALPRRRRAHGRPLRAHVGLAAVGTVAHRAVRVGLRIVLRQPLLVQRGGEDEVAWAAERPSARRRQRGLLLGGV